MEHTVVSGKVECLAHSEYAWVNSYENFPSFKKGLQQFRPNATYPSECGIPNLSFAGDWLKTSYPSALMERAVSTGREAANHVLLSDHVRQASFKVCPSHGPGIIRLT